MIEETRAVILRAMKYGDTSKIVTLYTRRFGKVKVVAKGARNQRTSKFGSSLEPMSLSSVVFYKKEHKDLHLLSKSETATPLNRIQEEPERMFTGLALVELVNMMMHDEEENAAIYDLLEQALMLLNGADRNAVNILAAFMVKLFSLFGFGIDADHCVRCGQHQHQQEFPYAIIRLSDGRFTCAGCSVEYQTAGVRLNGGTLRTLGFFAHYPLERAMTISVPSVMREDLLSLLQSYLRYHVEGVRTLRSFALLQTVLR